MKFGIVTFPGSNCDYDAYQAIVDQLGDDIATLSYEQALRTHARYRPPAPDLEPLPPADTDLRAIRSSTVPQRSAVALRPVAHTVEPPNPTLKTASITIRLSEAESAQLHRRAAESGLTLSAYLRSCTLEVETLRAQVKETLAQLRSPNTATTPGIKAASISPSAPPWWRRLGPAPLLSRLLQ